VAQTAEFVPAHLYATLKAAFHHRGLSFVRILQRCPVFTPGIFAEAVKKPALVELLVHDDGVVVPEIEAIYKSRIAHDPRDIDRARHLADATETIKLGVYFKDPSRPRYEEVRRVTPRTPQERNDLLNAEFDRYAV
jgi:2-oxoglutarate ferredoxin oxidoreductase subunit beta